MRRAVASVWLAATAGALGCGRPFLAPDGTLVVPQAGAHGAAVVTANGLVFRDKADVPHRIVVRDPYEPWRAPTGFLVPASGRFTKTSSPTVLSAPGLSITLRPSDTRVPSWGGEMLVRVDVAAAAPAGTARWGEDVAVVLDGAGEDTRALCEAALAQLGGRDRVAVVDAAQERLVVPAIPASNRSLVLAAVDRRLSERPSGRPDVTRAVSAALRALSRATLRRVLVLSERGDRALAGAVRGLGDDLVPLAVVSTADPDGRDVETRRRAVQAFVPPAGAPAFRDVVLDFAGTPAPSHLLEASGGDARWEIDGGELALGDLRSGDARTEVVRVSVPAWTAGEPFVLHVTARFEPASRPGRPRSASADLPCRYDDDLERLADSRHGDVIAYASALATLARLDAAFVGGSPSAARDLLPVARLHARSLALLARDTHDPAAAAQAALLEALLEAQ